MTTRNSLSSSEQQHETLQHFDKTSFDFPWNRNIGIMDTSVRMENETSALKIIEEQNLSQKMSQLSTSVENEKESLIKDIKQEIEKIPDYLTKRNKSFKEMLNQILSTTTTTLDNKTERMEDLRKIAILIYKIMVIQTYQLLWAAYIKSGMGQLIMPSKTKLSYSTTLSIWPKEIKTILQSSTKIDKTNEHEFYLNFVTSYLHELDTELRKYQFELNMKGNNFQGYTSNIQKTIETYIEQNLHYLRMEIEHKVELLHYDYHIHALKLEYFRHNPNDKQKEIMKQLCQEKYKQEITEQEYHFLKQQIMYYNSSSQSFECSPLAQCRLIDSIENATIRQHLFNQLKQVAEQSRVKMFNLYLKTAEDQRIVYKNKYDTSIKEMWSNQNHSSVDQSKVLSNIMKKLIDERCNKISERIQCIYKFKKAKFIESISKL